MSDDLHSNSEDQASRRLTPRAPGPFNGVWRGALSVALRIHDLSLGGCLVHSYHDVPPGRRLTLEIELPHEGWIAVHAETLYIRPDYGFAVRFVEVTDDVRARIEATVQRRLTEPPSELV